MNELLPACFRWASVAVVCLTACCCSIIFHLVLRRPSERMGAVFLFLCCIERAGEYTSEHDITTNKCDDEEK